MRPKYLLARFNDGTCLLGIEEWTDLLPPLPGAVRMKPLYADRASIEPFGSRQIEGVRLYELKRGIREGKTLYRKESELWNPFAPLAVSDDLLPLHNLLPIPRDTIRRVWHSTPWNVRKQTLGDETIDAVRCLLKELRRFLPGLSVDQVWTMGSLAYMLDATQFGDIDLAFMLGPHQALKLRYAVAALRSAAGGGWRPPEDDFVFPFKLQKGTILIDLFPCLDVQTLAGQAHPVRHAQAWIRQGRPHKRRAVVTDASLSCYAFPTVRVEGEPEVLVVGSNAFRGAFMPGDVIDCVVQRIRICTCQGSREADFICDPWNNLAGWQHLIEFSRDEDWLRWGRGNRL
jgi:hypothetical protein